MSENARRVYRNLGFMFVGIAALVILVVLGEQFLNFQFFNGNPLIVAVFLGFVGGALLVTVQQVGDLPEQDKETVKED